MNGVSLASMMLREKDSAGNEIDPKIALREKLAKGNVVAGEAVVPEVKPEPKEGEEEEEEEESEEEEEEIAPENETEEQKTERLAKVATEAADKLTAKVKRKEERIQARINKMAAARDTALAEVAALKAQLKADPDKTLTEEEVDARAEAKAIAKMKEKELADTQTEFDKICDKLQKEANKADKDFDVKVKDMAETFGPISTFMIGVLEDLENGGEVLAFLANDEDIAEKIYGCKPAKMTKELVLISNKLIVAKAPKPKKISAVPEPVEAIRTHKVQSLSITDADTKPENMDQFVAKRQRMIEERRKQGR